MSVFLHMISGRKHILVAIFVVVILALGLFSTWFIWNLTTQRLSAEALEEAQMVARSIDLERLKNLTGLPDDVNSPDYIQIKNQLIQIRLVHRTCRFLYLMGRRSDGTVFFFLDSQPPDSKDYAPPGLIYEEVSDEYLYAFDTGQQCTVGPIEDRWGILVTSLVPIINPVTNDLIAVLGMDIEADDWNKEIVSLCLLPVILTVFILILTVLLLIINRNRRLVKSQYLEKDKMATELQEALQHVKKLQGLLPICTMCKKIRDDKGYWNELEFYIEKHSDAQFSHGLCEDCYSKLYSGEPWYHKDKNKNGGNGG